ncbi:hypothetical protein BGZ68_009050 [Mortierella alpina]|nr:hypothetical protein BGZ68_009050 [Mortierella alpina]
MDLLLRAQVLLRECNDIVTRLNAWKACNPTFDADSLQKILHAEQKFLEKVTLTPAEEIKPVQINSSNVPYLKSLVCALIHSKNPVAIRKTFSYKPDRYSAMIPDEKFKTLPARTQKGRRGHNVMQLSTSQPLSTSLSNVKSFQVKVDLIADHGKSWLKINAGSVKSLLHEFADIEEDSDDEQDEDSEGESEEAEEDSLDEDSRSQARTGHPKRHGLKPAHVSKDTHADMTLLTRSLVLAADQNRLHYDHRPQVTLRFTGIVPEDEHSDAVKSMIHKSVRVGRVAESIEDGTVAEFPVKVVFGTMQLPTLPGVSAGTGMDPSFSPFSIPESVDDMVLFTKTLHLDITTLMALSSFLCHTIRPDPTLFTSPPLVLQAQQEHEQPLLPLLGRIFEGRERLVMSRTAATRFKSILSVIGGSEEQWRGRAMIHDPLEVVPQEGEDDKDLIRERWVRGSDWAQQYGVFADGPPRIEVIEDVLGPEEEEASKLQEAGSPNLSTLSLSESSSTGSNDALASSSKLSGPGRKELNMTELHSKIFMTGYRARLTTVTANLVGYRTVTRTGQVPPEISVWFHQPRSLAEAKLPLQ